MEHLVKFNAMKMAIMEAHAVDEIKLIRDKAEAYRYALIQAKESPEFIRKAEEIKLRAERRAGELLKDTEKQKPGQYQQRSQAITVAPTLSEIGITKNQSSQWQQIAEIPEEEFETFIDTSKEITTSGAVKVAQKRKRSKIREAATAIIELLPVSEFKSAKPSLIYADPPWKYDFAETDNRKIENQYETMTVEDIAKELPETEPNCLLLLWATAPKLREALALVDIWGFTYKTHAIWNKTIIGSGYWFRGQHELLLVATKGTISPPSPEHRVSSIFTEKRREHSKKPVCVYEWIEIAFPHLIWHEMFCRKIRQGWQFSGDQAHE